VFAIATVPLVVIVPPDRPVPATIWVTVPTEVVPPSATTDPLMVMLEFVRPELGIVVLMADAGILIAVGATDETRP